MTGISSQESCCCCYSCKSPTHKHKRLPDPAFGTTYQGMVHIHLDYTDYTAWAVLSACSRNKWMRSKIIHFFNYIYMPPSHCQATLVNYFVVCCFGVRAGQPMVFQNSSHSTLSLWEVYYTITWHPNLFFFLLHPLFLLEVPRVSACKFKLLKYTACKFLSLFYWITWKQA